MTNEQDCIKFLVNFEQFKSLFFYRISVNIHTIPAKLWKWTLVIAQSSENSHTGLAKL